MLNLFVTQGIILTVSQNFSHLITV